MKKLKITKAESHSSFKAKVIVNISKSKDENNIPNNKITFERRAGQSAVNRVIDTRKKVLA